MATRRRKKVCVPCVNGTDFRCQVIVLPHRNNDQFREQLKHGLWDTAVHTYGLVYMQDSGNEHQGRTSRGYIMTPDPKDSDVYYIMLTEDQPAHRLSWIDKETKTWVRLIISEEHYQATQTNLSEVVTEKRETQGLRMYGRASNQN